MVLMRLPFTTSRTRDDDEPSPLLPLPQTRASATESGRPLKPGPAIPAASAPRLVGTRRSKGSRSEARGKRSSYSGASGALKFRELALTLTGGKTRELTTAAVPPGNDHSSPSSPR